MWWLVRVWVPIAIAVTGVSAIAFAGIQQNYRQSLNDPQIQMAEDGAARLAAGGVPADVVPRGTLIDANGSLTPWIAVFDGSGKTLESTASIGTTSLSLPSGIFASAKASRGKDTTRPYEDRVTWQNSDGVRQAVVIVYVPQKDQYVAAGRNMREIESREWQLELTMIVGWLATLLLTFIATAFAARFAMYRNE